MKSISTLRMNARLLIAATAAGALLLISGCRTGLSLAAQPTSTPTTTDSPRPTATFTLAPTATFTPTFTPSITPTPTISPTFTITPTPTFDFPDVTVLMQANCRYGPGKAYLYSWGLYPGDHAEVHGRNKYGGWLWIKPANLDRRCWVSETVVEVTGDIYTVTVYESTLPKSTLYGPVQAVAAVRDGDQVLVYWEEVVMTKDDDRGYLIEAFICQGGAYFFVAVQTDKEKYLFTDEPGCPAPSSGLLYAVEKHGYTSPVIIPWPAP